MPFFVIPDANPFPWNSCPRRLVENIGYRGAGRPDRLVMKANTSVNRWKYSCCPVCTWTTLQRHSGMASTSLGSSQSVKTKDAAPPPDPWPLPWFGSLCDSFSHKALSSRLHAVDKIFSRRTSKPNRPGISANSDHHGVFSLWNKLTYPTYRWLTETSNEKHPLLCGCYECPK